MLHALDNTGRQKDILLNGWVDSGLLQAIHKAIEEIQTSVKVQLL